MARFGRHVIHSAPPYSAELMPIERVSAWMRLHDLSNRVLKDEAEIDAACAESWSKLAPERLQSITATARLTHENQAGCDELSLGTPAQRHQPRHEYDHQQQPAEPCVDALEPDRLGEHQHQPARRQRVTDCHQSR